MEVRTVRLKICFQSRFIHHTPLSHFTVSDFGKQHAVTMPLHQRTEFGMLQFQTGVFIVQNRFYCKSLQLSARPCRINSGKSGKLFSTVCLAIQCKQYTGSASFGQQFVVAAPGPDFGIRRHEDFHFGIGEYHRADVASVHDHARWRPIACCMATSFSRTWRIELTRLTQLLTSIVRMRPSARSPLT